MCDATTVAITTAAGHPLILFFQKELQYKQQHHAGNH
jgi:hypothetical protein